MTTPRECSRRWPPMRLDTVWPAPFTVWPPPNFNPYFEFRNPAIYNRRSHASRPLCSDSRTQERRDTAPDRLGEVHVRGRHRPSDDVLSAADIMAALFFAEMRFDPKDPQTSGSRSLRAVEGARRADSVRAWAEAGAFDRADLLNLRKIDVRSRRPSDAAAAVRRRRHRLARSGRVRGDRHRAQRAAHRVRLPDVRAARRRRERPKDRCGKRLTSPRCDGLDNLCAITDVNGLGQSRATQWDHDMEALARRWRAFGWHAIVIDGHDLDAILDALAEARRTKGQPTMIVARTIKGKGVSLVEGKDGWHGKRIQEGRGAGSRARRARSAVRARRRPGR